MRVILTLFLQFSFVSIFAQGYLMGRFDYMHRIDQPIYAYLDGNGTLLNGAETKTLPGFSFNESSINLFNNDWSFGQEVGLSIHRNTYQPTVPSSTLLKQQYFLMEGRVFGGKSFFNDLINLHAGPMIAIQLQDVGMGKFDPSDDNKWFWMGFSSGLQLRLGSIFIIGRYNHYFTQLNSTYLESGDPNTINVTTRISYFTLGLGLKLKDY